MMDVTKGRAPRARILLLLLGIALGLAGPAGAVTFPTYDLVYALSGHNSYFADNIFEPFASGNNQRLSDLLLHDRAGMVEFDIKKAEPGRWRVHHTWRLPGFNTQCEYLEDCLIRLQNFHYALPQHEVINVLIELKQTEPVLIHQIVPDVFDGDHTIEQLDATLRRYLGPALFTPADFLNDRRCASVGTLLACGERREWPTIDQLRGKFIVNLSGNFSSNHFNWARYAAEGNGIRARAAFPLRAVFDPCGNGQVDGDGYFPAKPIDPAVLQAARDNSIFWEMADWCRDDDDIKCGIPVYKHAAAAGCPAFETETRNFLDRQRGILRSIDSYEKVRQEAVIKELYQFIQTDWAWDFLPDDLPKPTDFVADMSRRFYDPTKLRGGVRMEPDALREPGNRIYIYNHTASDSTFHFLEAEPGRPATWEAVVASGNVDTTANDSHPPVRGEDGREASRGNGCLRAESMDGAEWVMICRRLLLKGEDWMTVSNDQTRVLISVKAQSDVEGAIDEWRKSHRSEVGDGLGDMLQMRIEDLAGGSQAVLSSASALIGHNLGAEPDYQVFQQVRFARPLLRQGLWAEGDKLFVRPRFKAAEPRELTLCDLTLDKGNRMRSGVVDFSFPVNCPPKLPPPRTAPPEPYCPDLDAGLCYDKCKPGFRGIGPVCWERCKPGYSDDGLFCRLDAKIVSADNSACPWYDKCAQGIIDRKPKGWCSRCTDPAPPGRTWKNDGCTCRVDAHIYAKTNKYGRGVGWIPGSR